MKTFKTLLLTGGEIHDYKSCGQIIEEVLKKNERFVLTKVEDDLSVLEAPRLDPYDIIVFYYTLGTITDTQKNGLLNFVSGGKGFVGCHSAAISFCDCPEYCAMVGGYFISHPSYREYQVSVIDQEHFITKGLSEFMVTDEQYILDYDPRVKVLCSALWKGKAMPVAWTKTWGRGRVFYLALGHDANACRHEKFGLLLERGTLWAVGLE